MSSERYSETRTLREETRRGTDGYDIPYHQRVNVPIQQSTNNFNRNISDQQIQTRIHRHDTTLQWVNDPITGHEKFRVNINIEGFNQNEINVRVDGNKLLVHGEHMVNTDRDTEKKTIDKSLELPRDVDTFSPHITFPSPNTIQVDFNSRHTNAIIDDGRISSNLISNYDTTHRTPPRFTQEKSSTEYTSTRKLGGGSGGGVGGVGGVRGVGGVGSVGGGSSSFERSSYPRTQSPYDDLYGGTNAGRTNAYSSTSHYQTIGDQSPLNRDFTGSTTASFSNSNNPTYTYRATAGDSQPRTTYSSSGGGSDTVQEKKYSETRHETQYRRSSPIGGVQSSREVEHHRSGSPSIGRSFDEDRFRSNIGLGSHSVMPPSSSRNVEVREYSRRVGGTANNNGFTNNDPLVFSQGFNRDAFYRSAFQPQIFTDDRGQQRVEMKLDVNNYEPNEIKVSVDGNDLIVKAEHNVDRPPTSSTRAYFYKQITLPPNTDFNSLSSQYHPDGRLHITAKLSPEQASIRYT